MNTIHFEGLLFDLDGTLIDSSEAIDRCWGAFASKYQISIDELLPAVQGKPAGESISAFRPNASDKELREDTVWLERMEADDTDGVIALPGSIALLNKLNDQSISWAIVTSGLLPVATARIHAARLPFPAHLVTPELIKRGKPDPEPYLLGAKKLGLEISNCVVFEDAPAGIESGHRAGAKTVGVLTQFSESDLKAKNADVCIATLEKMSITTDGSRKVITFNHL